MGMETTIERITGLRLELTTTVHVPPAVLWTTIADVPGIGAWSPECLGASWLDGATEATPGARFAAENRFADDRGEVVLGAEGVVTDVVAGRTFAWSMLDDDGLVGSRWRYDLSPVAGGTLVRHSWEHGPGTTGMRIDALADPPSVDRRLGTLARHMHATLVAMELHAREEVA
jgi:uncharacterized protein YndB with AHSA1/START domain